MQGIISKQIVFLGTTLVMVLVFTGIFVGTVFAQVGSTEVTARRAELERELAQLEAEIGEQQVILQEQKDERVSLERDIGILDAQITKAKLSIRARNLVIEGLSDDIVGKEEAIVGLNDKLQREKESLAQLIRKTNEIDDFSLIEIILSNQDLSSFFEDIDTFDTIKLALQDSFSEIEVTKDITRAEKESLQNKREEEGELRTIQQLQKRKIEVREEEKQKILSVTKGIESAYQSILNSKAKSAAQIRAELFTLRGSAAIPFEQALDFANEASVETDVRPALILAVIAEESNLGENVGTGNWRNDMHPTRDRPIFAVITRELGLDPGIMPVSRKPWYGWGGAMGPAQFIPSTWICYGGFINTNTGDCNNSKRALSWDSFWQGPWEYQSSKDRVKRVAGSNTISNPWDPKTAFMASALLLMDNGADRGTWEAERLAALRYFAGWNNARKASYAFYGDDIVGEYPGDQKSLISKYQGLIDVLGQN